MRHRVTAVRAQLLRKLYRRASRSWPSPGRADLVGRRDLRVCGPYALVSLIVAASDGESQLTQVHRTTRAGLNHRGRQKKLPPPARSPHRGM